ncbi:Uncharacterized protein dnm_029720 [Desulfonema magnum]|uniref:Uncharacterized protein n=1 Tax=Desulfonema magnum TaxID=45655 RepID=A0A975BK96_9BACT|nr:Uncharacterized protein dnm_029720 [Desulfonema magnum]
MTGAELQMTGNKADDIKPIQVMVFLFLFILDPQKRIPQIKNILIITDFGEARGFFRGIGQYDSGQEDETDVPARNIR